MRHLTVFLDDGGVLNDNARRAPEWQRLVGEFGAVGRVGLVWSAVCVGDGRTPFWLGIAVRLSECSKRVP